MPIILGTARQGRQSEKVANFVLQQAVATGIESEIIDVRDYGIEATDNTQTSSVSRRLAEKLGNADALIIVTPEYNHGYPGELKMMLDMLYQQYFNKPVGFCGVSAGPLGGSRAVEQLRQVAIELHMVPVREAVYFPVVQQLFDYDGSIKDAAFSGRVKRMLDEIVWYAERLKKGQIKE